MPFRSYNFYVPASAFHSIACCVTHFIYRSFIEQNVDSKGRLVLMCIMQQASNYSIYHKTVRLVRNPKISQAITKTIGEDKQTLQQPN